MTQSTTIGNSSSNPNNIKNNARIVYVIAPSGTGKSFTGDYLALMHGFDHVDGDGPLKNQHLPQYKDMAAKVWKMASEYLPKNEDGPKELWQPYFAELARQTLRAAETSERGSVVLTHATYRKSHREYLLEKLIEGGASKDQVSVVALTIDEDVKLRGLYLRSKHLFESKGETLEGYFRDVYGWDGEGEMTCEDYVSFVRSRGALASLKFEDPPAGSKVVDVSSRNIDTLNAIDDALGLLGKRQSSWAGDDDDDDNNLAYEEIVERVKAIDAKRDEEFSKNVDIKKMVADFNDDDDDDEIEEEEKKEETVSEAERSRRGC